MSVRLKDAAVTFFEPRGSPYSGSLPTSMTSSRESSLRYRDQRTIIAERHVSGAGVLSLFRRPLRTPPATLLPQTSTTSPDFHDSDRPPIHIRLFHAY